MSGGAYGSSTVKRRRRGLVEEAIERHIDPHARELTLMAERNEREGLRRLRGMIGGGAWASD